MATLDEATSATATSRAALDQQPSDGRQQQLLFSLQFFLSSVDLRLPQTTRNSSSKRLQEGAVAGFLVGFQLLQYEIVLFDAVAVSTSGRGGGDDAIADIAEATTSFNGGSESVLLKLQHGKSCLFEADTDHLALELQRECDAPLALLIMQQEHGKARLVAFASVPIELHVGLINAPNASGVHGASINQEMRFRICEWASSNGIWKLRDHCNRVVGVATGAATLSCLGRTLAPHIVNAIGLQVDKAELPVPDDGDMARSLRSKVSVQDSNSPGGLIESSGTADSKKRESTEKSNTIATVEQSKNASADALSATLGSEPVAASKADMAVQCDLDLVFGSEDAQRIQTSPRAASQRNCLVYPAIRIDSVKKHACSSSHQLSPSPVKTRSPRIHHPVHHDSRHADPRKSSSRHHHPTEPDSSLFFRELPPPLFFQKPKQQQPKKKR